MWSRLQEEVKCRTSNASLLVHMGTTSVCTFTQLGLHMRIRKYSIVHLVLNISVIKTKYLTRIPLQDKLLPKIKDSVYMDGCSDFSYAWEDKRCFMLKCAVTVLTVFIYLFNANLHSHRI